VRRLRRCAHSLKRDHDGHAQGISVTLIARRPLGLQGTRGGSGAAPGWAAGAEAAGHVAAPKLLGAGQRERRPQDTWLPRTGQWKLRPQNTWRPRSWLGPCGSRRGKSHAGARDFACLTFCLDLKLIRGVPDLQGTDNLARRTGHYYFVVLVLHQNQVTRTRQDKQRAGIFCARANRESGRVAASRWSVRNSCGRFEQQGFVLGQHIYNFLDNGSKV
jgi:hypothetical protein